MPEDSENFDKKERQFSHAVDIREKRKIRAEKKKKEGFWFGLGMFGVVGWSVAVPTVAGIFIGLWIDIKYPSRYSWTLMLMIIGIVSGCANAWRWITRERNGIKEEREDNGD
ncbi:MAG: AtpZ/AtpI family protein [Proteobacteria bacterium]|nr:AtpZ/AtpI family protein [Pseudomonadota bacterium]